MTASPRFRNWSRTHGCRPERRLAPASEADVVALLAAAARDGRRVKVVRKPSRRTI